MIFETMHIDQRHSSRDYMLYGQVKVRGRFCASVDEFDIEDSRIANHRDLPSLVSIWKPIPRWMKAWEVLQ